MKIDKVAFDEGLANIRTYVQKFDTALQEMDKKDEQKIIEAGNWFYANLISKIQPLREDLKLKVQQCIDDKDYESIPMLIVCLREIDDTENLIIGLRQDEHQ